MGRWYPRQFYGFDRVMNEPSQSTHRVPDAKLSSHQEINFSSTLTALCLLVCVSGFVFLLWSVSASEVVPESVTVSRDLERLGSRMLEFESRLSELSSIERGMFRLWGEEGDTQAQLRQWYQEFPHERRHPIDELYAGILDGEAELKTEIMESIKGWSSENSPPPVFRRLLQVGYLGSPTERIDFDMLQARLAEEVPTNWFYFQLAQRLARQSGDQVLHANLQGQIQQLTDAQLWKWRTLVILELTLGGIGFMCFVYLAVMWFKQRTAQSAETSTQLIPSWTFQEGMAVLVRGGALSIILIALVAVGPNGENLLEDYGSLLLYFPTVGLAMAMLCRPKKQSLLAVLGCNHLTQTLRSFLPILLSVIALGLIGDWLIMLGGDTLEFSVHWTEWFLPELVWSSQAELLKITMEVVVLAPIFEEIIFRGLVFSTLRAKFGFPVSMMGSAVIFALAHGYGPIAFLTVLWSGMLWAWIYERTGSVVPGMCAHAINNGLVVYFLVALFR